MDRASCYGCENLVDDSYVECIKLHRKDLAPDDCPKRKEMEQEDE